VYFEVRKNGQTPGKRLAGIRAIRDSGAPLDLRSAMIRNLLRFADFLPGFYLLGAFLVLLTSRHQRLGDMAAGTLVIRERLVEAPEDLTPVLEKIASPEIAFTEDQLAPCLPEGRFILRSFFERYQQMESEARARLVNRLTADFLSKTKYQLPAPLANWRAEIIFLASLYRDLERLKQHDH
jgi:hypothetical protein